jgi:hypothetical protein
MEKSMSEKISRRTKCVEEKCQNKQAHKRLLLDGKTAWAKETGSHVPCVWERWVAMIFVGRGDR